jgi:hypothetical protein
MRYRTRCLMLFVVMALTGWAQTPSFGMNVKAFPPIPAGKARVILYRWLEPYESSSFVAATLDGNTIGYTQNGAALYSDMLPGHYAISLLSHGRFPTASKSVTVVSGQILYARIESLSGWDPIFPDETFVVAIVDPVDGNREIQNLERIPAEQSVCAGTK